MDVYPKELVGQAWASQLLQKGLLHHCIGWHQIELRTKHGADLVPFM